MRPPVSTIYCGALINIRNRLFLALGVLGPRCFGSEVFWASRVACVGSRRVRLHRRRWPGRPLRNPTHGRAPVFSSPAAHATPPAWRRRVPMITAPAARRAAGGRGGGRRSLRARRRVRWRRRFSRPRGSATAGGVLAATATATTIFAILPARASAGPDIALGAGATSLALALGRLLAWPAALLALEQPLARALRRRASGRHHAPAIRGRLSAGGVAVGGIVVVRTAKADACAGAPNAERRSVHRAMDGSG